MAHTQDHAPPRVIHYAPGDRPLCGNESSTAVYSDDPRQVAGCGDCLELVAEDLKDHDWYHGYCLNCLQEIAALGGAAGRRAVRRPCPRPRGLVSMTPHAQPPCPNPPESRPTVIVCTSRRARRTPMGSNPPEIAPQPPGAVLRARPGRPPLLYMRQTHRYLMVNIVCLSEDGFTHRAVH